MKKKGQRKKQEKSLKKRTQRKLSHGQAGPAGPTTELRYIRQARNYPIEGCWIRRDWEATGLAVIVLARRQPNGNLAFASYLVDYYCLGLKDTACYANIPPRQFQQDYLSRFFPDVPPRDISPALAHELIHGSVEYAAQFGFQPHRDFKHSKSLLDPPDLHPRSGKVKFGKEGKPFFVAGPHDNVAAITRQLSRSAGEGNYHFLMPLASPADNPLLGDDDGDDDDAEVRKSLAPHRPRAAKKWWQFWK